MNVCAPSTAHGGARGGDDGGDGGHGGGGDGGGGDGGGDGGGGDGGARGTHTRQPEVVTERSVDHWIVPGPKMKLEGPPPPEKLVHVPDGWLGMWRWSQHPSVLKEVAVRGLPMASEVDVMEHA